MSLLAATAVWLLVKNSIQREPARTDFNFGRTAPALTP